MLHESSGSKEGLGSRASAEIFERLSGLGLKENEFNNAAGDHQQKSLIVALRAELKKAYLLLDMAKLREDKFKGKITELQQEIASIKGLVESSVVTPKKTANHISIEPSGTVANQDYCKRIKQLNEMIQKANSTNQFLKDDRDRLDLENIQLKKSLKDTEKRVLKLAKVKSRLESKF